jgi:peroxiredoxin
MPIGLLILGLAGIGTVDFELPDAGGRTRRLSEMQNRPAVVLAFLGTECPVSQQYAQRLQEFASQLELRNVAIIGVFANPGDSATAINRMRDQLHLTYPLLRDCNQSLARRLRVSRQSEVVVLDQARHVCYRGRVDDQFSPGARKARIGREDLRIALTELLAHKPISVPLTEPVGCPLEQAPAEADPRASSWGEVAPILSHRCVSCHRDGGIAPFSLQRATGAARWAGAIREAIVDRRMPPWHADLRYGKFANDPSLSDSERDSLLSWVKAGAPIGDVSDAPSASPADAQAGWRIHGPDRIVSMPQPFNVPATGDIPYQYIEVDPGFTEDTWVQEAEILPGNRSAVHHSTVFLRAPGTNDLAAQGELNSFCLCAYAMGTPPTILPAGMAKKVPAGWKFVFVMHYVANGAPQTDRTSIGLKLANPRDVQKEVATNILMDESLVIPPRRAHYVVSRNRTFDKDVLLLSLFPHMHLRGSSFLYEATYPDGRKEVLLSVPKWDMDWQHRYVLAEPLRLPAGTTLTATAVYDNSAANPNNPNPDAEVHAGLQTTDEMFNGYYDFCLADQDLTQHRRVESRMWTLAGIVAFMGLAVVLRRRIAYRKS